MRNGVYSGASGDIARLRKRQLRVEDGDLCRRLRVAAGHFLMGLSVRNKRERLALAARSSRSGNDDQRQHLLLCLTNTPIILHPPAIG